MTRVVNQVTIDGPIETVFDEVTTTATWLSSAPGTLAVSATGVAKSIAPGTSIVSASIVSAVEGEFGPGETVSVVTPLSL